MLLVLNVCVPWLPWLTIQFSNGYIFFSVPLFNSLLKDILAILTDEGTCQDYLLEKEPKHTVDVHKGTTKLLKNFELVLKKRGAEGTRISSNEETGAI